MNLNELFNRPKGRGKRCTKNKNYIDMAPQITAPVKKKDYTPSSDLNWGKSHISIANTSSSHKSASSSKISSEEGSRVIIALTEGRGEARCEVGIAAIDVSKPLLVLCQMSDTQSYANTLTKINILNPQEILVPVTFVQSFYGNRLIEKVKERYPNIKYVGCPRSTFNKTNGMDILSKLCIPSLNAVLLVLEHRYYALAAASALITYVQDVLFVYYAVGSVKIDYQESEGYAIIDVATADRLELVCSAKPAQGNKYSSLFGVINHCVTKIGSRTLRSSILQPPYNSQYIEARLNAVTELMKHPEMLLSIQALLQKVPNIDLLLTVATLVPDDPQRCSNRHLNYILLLNTFIDLVVPLKDILSKATHPFFAQLAQTLASEDLVIVKEIVRSTIHENAQPAKGQAAVLQRCYAIKPGINGLLDLVRKTFSERLDDMREYVKRLAQKYDLALTLGNNQTKGYHIVLNLDQKQKRYMKKSDLPEEFIEVYRLSGSFTMKTPEIVNLSTRIDDIMDDILRISNVMVHSIIVEIKQYIGVFYKLCDEIAYLDVLQSLAECSVRNGYVRPKFGDFTEVTFAHHPMLDFLLSKKPIPNPISCSSDYNLHIITGPNGSGKSIFIRQVVLLQVMAQVGCYVPAQTAIFRPADRMYARIYLEDNMEHGASSFILEMKEIKYITSTMTQNSLVIVDELCRSTSVEEGTALAIAVVEKLVQSSAYIYITTHYTLLTKLYDMYLNVKVWQLETLPSGDDPKTFKLDFRHSLMPGVTSIRRYGVYMVRNIWCDSILKYVDELLDRISKKPKSPNIVSLDEKLRLKYKTESELAKLKSQGKLTVAKINKLLNQYQDELQKLGYPVNVVPLQPNFAIQELPRIEHSIFGQDYVDEELQVADERMRQNFTPQPSLSSQLSTNLGTQRAEGRIQQIFTPESWRQSEYTNCVNQSCPNMKFYQNYEDVDAKNNFLDGYQDQNFQNDSNGSVFRDNYENISRFIAESSENIHKLAPEVNLSYERTPQFDQNGFAMPQNIFQSHQNALKIQTPNHSLNSDASKALNSFQFSLPLQNNASRTSTPLIQKAPRVPRSASPVVRVYRGNKRNFSTSTETNQSFNRNNNSLDLEQLNLDGLDLESIQEDLEACSRIFSEAGDGFEEESLNTAYKSIQNECEEKTSRELPKEKFQHIIPIVKVIEGLNNTTISIDENDFKDIPDDCDRRKEDKEVPKKINIISNIVIKSEQKARIEGETITKKESTQMKAEINEGFDTVVKSYGNGGTNFIFEETNRRDQKQHIGRFYKSFDSTFEAARTNTDMSVQSKDANESFKSCIEEKVDRLHRSCRSNFKMELKDVHKNLKESEPSMKNEAIEDEREDSREDLKEPKSSSAGKTEMTSISFASKARKLDRSSSSSSPKDGGEKTTEDKTVTSLSNASKMRNLDQATTDSASANEKTKDSDKCADTSSSLKESDENKSKTEEPAKKSKNRLGIKKWRVKKGAVNQRFVPPRKLTAREIKEEFMEQDRKILESGPSSPNYSKYLEQVIKRPTVKQVRNATHLALIRKTHEGIEVIPAQSPRKKMKTMPAKAHGSNECFDVSMFSDKNAPSFENFLNSNEKSYKTFCFNFNDKKKEDEQNFKFEPTTMSVGEYTSNSVTKRFSRTLSETFPSGNSLENAGSVRNLSFLPSQQSVNHTLTPEGFYKQNKEDINRILGKYLQRGNQEAENFFSSVRVGKSIFETDDIDANDLSL